MPASQVLRTPGPSHSAPSLSPSVLTCALGRLATALAAPCRLSLSLSYRRRGPGPPPGTDLRPTLLNRLRSALPFALPPRRLAAYCPPPLRSDFYYLPQRPLSTLAFSPPSYLPPCSLAHDYLTLQSIHTRPFSTRESTAAERPRTTTCIAGGCAAARRGLMSRSVSEKSVIELAIRVMTHCDCAFCLGNVVVVSPPLPLSSTISLTSS